MTALGDVLAFSNDAGGSSPDRYYPTTHELLLIATHGSMQPDSFKPLSVLVAPRVAHSEKPEIFAETIERMYPGCGMRRLELFARRARDGWTVWGNQAPVEDQP